MDEFSTEHDVPQIMPRVFQKCDDLSPLLQSQGYAQGNTNVEEMLEYGSLELNVRKRLQLKLSNGFRGHQADKTLSLHNVEKPGRVVSV